MLPNTTAALTRITFAFLMSTLCARALADVRVTYVSPPTQTVAHEFVYQSVAKVGSVYVAGTFNHWSMTADALKPDSDGKTWRSTLHLPVGDERYKFVVDGGKWLTDPSTAKANVDNDGNSVLFLTPSDYKQPASPRDGVTTLSALVHPTCEPYLNYDRGRLTLSLRARRDDLASVRLRLGHRICPMTIVSDDGLYDYWSTDIGWNRRTNLTYTFEIVDGIKTLSFGADGLASQVEPFCLKAARFSTFTTPAWPERSILYQIFPDRFADGDASNDPAGVQPWTANPTPFNRFGGDIQGIRDHLSYLSDLGISAVYFTPVFKSQSNHRYDVADYKTVDPELGTDQSFIKLTRDLKSRGMRTVMDFVFNHSSASFAPFEDVVAKGESSNYRDWFFIHGYPVHAGDPPNYETYGGWWGMPRLNETNPATREYMIAVVDYWMREASIDGLRFDVADMVDMSFWRRLRSNVKHIDPQMWMVGERWGDASPWLMGDQWDASMNYPFLSANVDFFADAKIPPSTYASRLMGLYHSYARQVSRCMMNSLSTHDTPRFLTRCHNNSDLDLLAATVQFTWVGMPCIYYGEELGMQGGADPDNRRPMAWRSVVPDNRFLRYYKKLIAIRKSSRALQSGTPAILVVDDTAQTLAYSRTLGRDVAIVAVNRSTTARTMSIPFPSEPRVSFVDALSSRRVATTATGTLQLRLAPLSAAILLPAHR